MKKYFLTGLATLLPLAVTVYVVVFFVRFLTHPFMGLMVSLLEQLPLEWPNSEQAIQTTSEVLILICLFLFTLFLGMVARWFFFNTLIKIGDKILHKIPLVNKVYKTTKDIIQTLFVSEKKSFKQVVMIPFPHKECYCLGLISRDSPTSCSDSVHDDLVSVFVPTTPNPTTGFLIMIPKADLIFLDMKSEEAIKYIVSCGVMVPGRPGGEDL
jgi:uncharacterized membrane protein